MSACSSCGATGLVWATMAVSGKKVPLEAAECRPTERGALFLVDGRWVYTGKQIADRLGCRERVDATRALQLASSRYPTHLSHFAKCPHADQHRRSA